MASAAYLALLEESSVPWVILCELTAREDLRPWTSEGSNTYSTPFDPFTHPVALRADRGLYRELVGVWENTTALTALASVAAVKAAGSSAYFFDPSDDTLYVKTSGLVDPDTVSLMQAVFTVRLATQPMAFADEPPHDAQIDGQSLPSMRFDRPELLRGISTFPSGDLTVVNSDGFWDYPAAAWNWANAEARFLAGASTLDYADFEPLPTMQVSQPPAAGDETAILQLRSQSNATDRSFPQHTLAAWYGETVALLGAEPSVYMPMWWGVAQDVPLVFAGDMGSTNRWITIDPNAGTGGLAVAGLEAIERASGTRTVLVEGLGNDYIVLGGADGRIDIDPVWDPETHDIVATEVTRTGGATCGAIASAILAACGVPASLIDQDAFDTADTDNPARLGIYVAGGQAVEMLTSGTELLNLIERSTLASIHIGADGRWTMQVWDPSVDLSAMPARTDADLLNWQPVPNITAPVVPAITVRYAQQVTRDTWSTTEKTSGAAEARLVSTANQIVDTVLIDAVDAVLLAARLQLVASRAKFEVDVEDGPAAMSLVPGDKVRITRSRGPSRLGTFDAALEVQAIQKRPATMTVDMTLGNQRGLGVLVKTVAADGGAAWASAEAADKLQHAYGCDDAGYVDASDASTFEQAVVW